MMPEISVIIPTLNEAEHIQELIGRIGDNSLGIECIVVDGGSTDNTVKLAQKSGAKVIEVKVANRAIQLNRGAAVAEGKILYFVHADTLPPKKFSKLILTAVKSGYGFGCFRFRFNSPQKLLRINSWCTRYPLMIFRGGDQSLFITRDLFEQIGGYNETKKVMEDYDIITRGKKHNRFKIIQENIEVSPRKYQENSYFRVNVVNFFIFSMYYLGVPTTKLAIWYGKLIKHPKTTKTDQEPVFVENENSESTFVPLYERDNKLQ